MRVCVEGVLSDLYVVDVWYYVNCMVSFMFFKFIFVVKNVLKEDENIDFVFDEVIVEMLKDRLCLWNLVELYY